MQKLIIALSLFLILSCSKDDENATTSNSLIGSSWEGTFNGQSTDQSTPESQKVELSLNEDQTFVIAMSDKVLSATKGKFLHYPRNKSLTFDVTDSNVESFGLSGKSYVYSYLLADDELKLEGAMGTFLLMRRGQSGDADATSHPLVGEWRCPVNNSAVMTLNVEKDEFRGRKEEANQRTVYFEGSVRLITAKEDKEPEAGLNIKTSNLKSLVGNDLILRATGNSQALLIQVNSDGKEVSEAKIGCKKP